MIFPIIQPLKHSVPHMPQKSNPCLPKCPPRPKIVFCCIGAAWGIFWGRLIFGVFVKTCINDKYRIHFSIIHCVWQRNSKFWIFTVWDFLLMVYGSGMLKIEFLLHFLIFRSWCIAVECCFFVFFTFWDLYSSSIFLRGWFLAPKPLRGFGTRKVFV